MATLNTLSGTSGPLTLIRVPLGRGMQPQRSFYACPDFMGTLVGEFRTWRTGRLNAALSPQDQFDVILQKWISGQKMLYERMIQDLMPTRDEVWELKTADLRLFGWIYRPRVFIAAKLGYTDWYKPPTKRFTYEDARNEVMNVRDRLDLDPPKFATGEFDALV